MSLYQTSVLKNYISLQENAVIEKAYKKYVKYFLNPTIQENIRSSKEEEYQGIFLTELFVNILDYTLKPNPNFNLVAEFKNQTNSRKADGAILHKDIAVGVIELKGTKTKDLESIRKQAFDYKANQKGCIYVITSNFEKLRFYINDATEFIEFNLFELTKERFKLFYLCLQKNNIINNIPLKIKEASLVQEEKITKDFYKDYSLFKRELYRDLVKQNAKRLKLAAALQNTKQAAAQLTEEEKAVQQQLEKNVKLTLFKKSQKLIDRFLFIFFAEDRGLLPANSTELILEKWKADIDFGDERPLYNLFKQYFTFLDQGRKGTKSRGEIYAYNGGLFKEDTLLNGLEIDNNLLYKHTHKLAAYDFESQVDVNILGHIFENSLNEIESVNAEIEGADFDKQKSKRKKDGVFYTPKYITKYIVENTVGKLCEEKKTELGIKEEEYFKGRKNRNKTTISHLVAILDAYRAWLLSITICDPACGSGAFLNQALNFLIAEHGYIDELKTKVLGGGLQFSDIENTILENNIFGVDLNEESVEIAKLSLWLRTAQPRRKLNNLSSNIKCGNSLIDSKTVAGDKAFSWETEFPQVFEKGGFDVIIGNPPYVNFANLPKQEREFFKKTYKVCKNKTDLYAFFVEKSTEILKPNSQFSFIFPHTWVSTISFTPLRKLFFYNYKVNSLVELEHGVFQDAIVKTVIIVCEKGGEFDGIPIFNEDFKLVVDIPKKILLNDKELIINFDWTPEKQKVEDKLFKNSRRLDEFIKFTRGIKTSNDKRFLSFEKKNEDYKKVIRGRNIKAYRTDFVGEYIWYRPDLMREKIGCLPHTKELFEVSEKLIAQRVNSSGQLLVAYDDKQHYCLDTTNVSVLKKDIEVDLKYILVLLNSKLINWWFNDKFKMPTISGYELHQIPIILSKEKEKLILDFGIKKLEQEPKFRDLLNKLQIYLKQKFQLQKLPKKLQNWHELEFGDFIKELNKAIKANNKLRAKQVTEGVLATANDVPTLTKKDEFEWLDLFEENKQKAQDLQTQINQTDQQIDAMVYELYGLTDEEIDIVENS